MQYVKLRIRLEIIRSPQLCKALPKCRPLSFNLNYSKQLRHAYMFVSLRYTLSNSAGFSQPAPHSQQLLLVYLIISDLTAKCYYGAH